MYFSNDHLSSVLISLISNLLLLSTTVPSSDPTKNILLKQTCDVSKSKVRLFNLSLGRK